MNCFVLYHSSRFLKLSLACSPRDSMGFNPTQVKPKRDNHILLNVGGLNPSEKYDYISQLGWLETQFFFCSAFWGVPRRSRTIEFSSQYVTAGNQASCGEWHPLYSTHVLIRLQLARRQCQLLLFGEIWFAARSSRQSKHKGAPDTLWPRLCGMTHPRTCLTKPAQALKGAAEHKRLGQQEGQCWRTIPLLVWRLTIRTATVETFYV